MGKPTEITALPIDRIFFDAKNANVGTERGRQVLAHSLATYGAGRSILVDRQDRVIAGNKSLAEAVAAGIATVRVVETDGSELVAVRRTDLDLDEPKARLLAFADNRSSELDLAWNVEQIAADLDAGLDLSALWTGDELEELLRGLQEPGGGLVEGVDPDVIPESVPSRCQPGDLWQLGRHRLLCGDSTKAEDVARLMEGEEADLCFTSPPYDQQRQYTGGIGDWLTLMQGVFGNLPMVEKGQVLVNLGLVHRDGEWRPYWDPWIAWMREQGWRAFGWYVWDQGPGLCGDWNGRLAPAHEFIFHFNQIAEKARKSKATASPGCYQHGPGFKRRDGSAAAKKTGHGQPVQPKKIPDSVIRVMRQKVGGLPTQHPAIFPVALVAEIMQAFSDPGDLCFEPFAGSGTALIAGHEHGRRVCALEQEATYCDIAIARFEQATGLSARRLD
jgi:DNA modification methylase